MTSFLSRLTMVLPCMLAVADLARAPVTAGQELPPMAANEQPKIESVSPNLKAIPRYDKFELAVQLAASYDNPFDPRQIDLEAEFLAPSGKKIAVSGFFYQPYREREEGKSSALDDADKPCWKVRFAPTEVGAYQYRLRLKNQFGKVREEVLWGPEEFECTTSANHGFLRVSPVNHRYFQFDDGTAWFAVGQNLQNDWHQGSHYRPLAAAECNAVRVWTFCHWTWLEWTFKPDISWAKQGHWMRSYAGAGRYNQRIAWIADQQLAQCERDGLRLMFCMGNGTGGGELSQGNGYGSWDGHPYNTANGGFLSDAKQFWTDTRARELYKQRLRYIVARYGYSTNVWAWEFWNELGDARPEIVAWHREMGDYLREIDPNRHLVTTSTWQALDKFTAVWALAQMDFTQTHIYESADAIHRGVEQVLRKHPDKPHIVGEGGGPPAGRDPKDKSASPVVDPENVEFHNSLWAAAMSGAAGATLPWWWRDRIEPGNLFFHYTAIARFVRNEPWATMKPEPARLTRVWLAGAAARRHFSPVILVPLGAHWGSKAPRNRFIVEPDGSLSHAGDFRGTLFGSRRAEWQNPPVLAVDYPAAGRFIVHVKEASGGALEIVVDGKSLLREKLPTDKDHKVQKSFSVDVPAGRHEIELRNAGPDWLRVGHILLTDYRDAAKYPDLDIYGVQSDRSVCLWIHHRLSALGFQAAGFRPEPIQGVKAQIAGLADGRYRVEWWDTYQGQVTGTAEVESRGGSLEFEIPAVATDVACKIRPEARAGLWHSLPRRVILSGLPVSLVTP